VSPPAARPPLPPAPDGRGWPPGLSFFEIRDLDGVLVLIVPLTGYGRAEAELVADGIRRPETVKPDRLDTWTTNLTG
jgi:hypothetical protein